MQAGHLGEGAGTVSLPACQGLQRDCQYIRRNQCQPPTKKVGVSTYLPRTEGHG